LIYHALIFLHESFLKGINIEAVGRGMVQCGFRKGHGSQQQEGNQLKNPLTREGINYVRRICYFLISFFMERTPLVFSKDLEQLVF